MTTQELERSQETGNIANEISIGTIVPSAMLELMFTQARKFPRDEQMALQSALQELQMVPNLASKSYYSIPYSDSASGKKTPVEGLTIGSLMAMTRRWGNIVTGGLLLSEDEKGWDVVGICFDIESNTYNAKPYRASKFYKPHGSQGMVPLMGQQKQNALLSAISKAIRNASRATLPAWFYELYFEEAKRLVLSPPKNHTAATKSIQERILDAKAVFKKQWAVTDQEMSAYLGGLTLEDDASLLQHLKGLYNGITEGQTNVDTVFGREKTPPSMPKEK